jgi:8-oxo-dGTP diphosphatase
MVGKTLEDSVIREVKEEKRLRCRDRWCFFCKEAFFEERGHHALDGFS